jgi:hypothetical protein
MSGFRQFGPSSKPRLSDVIPPRPSIVPWERVRRQPKPDDEPIEIPQFLGLQPKPEPRPTELDPAFIEMLEQYRDATKHCREPVWRIIERVGKEHNVSLREILGDNKCNYVVKARWAAMAEVRRVYPDKSLPWLGRRFNRDHTSVLHALRKMEMYPGPAEQVSQ